ncbi:MAG: galactokinase family protein [Bacteroidota bacterium]|nr:galactokinase family protein [Bacteroidota bacterium]
MSNVSPFVSFAPGRVCLFGEHQDYLGLSVIAAAIPLGCRLVVAPLTSGLWTLSTPALNFTWQCHVDEAIAAQPEPSPGPSDFLRAGLHEALKAGWDVRCGGAVAGHVDLPVQAGLSSSSALVVAWVQALAHVAGVALTPHELAAMAHRVEVLHFSEPGGHMDHVASAVGGTLRIHPDGSTTPLKALEDGVWVVVDSGQPKDTRGHLTRCKTQRQQLVSAHGGVWRAPTALPTWAGLSEAEQRLWQATWQSKALEERASGQWSSSQKLAGWMTDHHAALRDGLELSTPRLEAIGRAALEAGAWGWKLVGSGGGGCALVWCERDKTSAVHRAVRKVGAKASWTVGPSKGAHCHPWTQPTMPAIVLAAGRSSRMKIFGGNGPTGWTEEEVQLLQTRSKAMLPISPEGKPFLALLLERLVGEGVDDVCVVLSSEDCDTPEWLSPWIPEGLSVGYARQTIPPGRDKPMGTADAVQRGLEARPEWKGRSVAIFNGDNLPPEGAVAKLKTTEAGMLAFAQSHLGLPIERTKAFAIVEGSSEEGVHALLEKPSVEDVERLRDEHGEVWVSMNVFRLPYEALLAGCTSAPIHPERQERELPTAALLAAERNGAKLQWIPCRGAFLDLTHPQDWKGLREEDSWPKLQNPENKPS